MPNELLRTCLVCHKRISVHQMNVSNGIGPERAKYDSPGQRPGWNCHSSMTSPVRATQLQTAFCVALTGLAKNEAAPSTQGVALGYHIQAFQACGRALDSSHRRENSKAPDGAQAYSLGFQPQVRVGQEEPEEPRRGAGTAKCANRLPAPLAGLGLNKTQTLLGLKPQAICLPPLRGSESHRHGNRKSRPDTYRAWQRHRIS